MNRLKLSLPVFAIPLLLSFLYLAVSVSHAGKDEHKHDIVQGNIVCLLPDHKEGTVKPVIASEPCYGIQPHAHVIVGTKGEHKGFVYAIEGSENAIEKFEKRKDRKDVKVEGSIRGSQKGWILSID